jgi:DsbC/DsbD-like thiol-disulfide interchange protein
MHAHRKHLEICLTLSLLLTCAGSASAQSFAAAHAKVELVAEEASSGAAGHTVWLGVLFDLDKGWHTYWVNPGDSGEAPKIQWDLPKGFRAGEIRWPVPARLITGTIVDYGYEGRVLLAVPVQVPADYKGGAPVALAADVRYLVCRDVCIPAKAHPTLTISASGGDATAAGRELFANARNRWPTAMPANWKVAASDAGDHFVLSIETGAREPQAVFFPLSENVIDNAAPQKAAPTDHGTSITLKKSELLTTAVAKIEGVVVFGANRAVEIAAPVSRGR